MAIIVVSGLPRSGTSVMMQMLQAAGISILSDGERCADEDNPQGYLELECVKKIKQHCAWLDDADGKAVKIIAPLIFELPGNFQYQVIVMQRDLIEVLASQQIMITRRGKKGSDIPTAMLSKIFEKQRQKLTRWLAVQENCTAIEVFYAKIIEQPLAQMKRVTEFLQIPIDHEKMMSCIKPELYRNIN